MVPNVRQKSPHTPWHMSLNNIKAWRTVRRYPLVIGIESQVITSYYPYPPLDLFLWGGPKRVYNLILNGGWDCHW